MPRLIKTTYEVVTPESAAEGEAAETGWEDEAGQLIEPDEYDIEEYESEFAAVVALACRAMGFVQPSSSRWHRGVWYTDIEPDMDYATNAETSNSFHLEGFTPAEELAIFQHYKRLNK
jgi:hypothetical protein